MRAVAGLVVAAALSGLAQPGSQVFRSRTIVTEMDVDVRGADGTRVTGLTVDDFEVSEDGEAQTLINIETMTPLTLTATPAAHVPVAAERAGLAAGPVAPATNARSQHACLGDCRGRSARCGPVA